MTSADISAVRTVIDSQQAVFNYEYENAPQSESPLGGYMVARAILVLSRVLLSVGSNR